MVVVTLVAGVLVIGIILLYLYVHTNFASYIATNIYHVFISTESILN